MRKFAGICGAAGLLLSIAAIGFAADPPAKTDKKDEIKDKIGKLAEDIFTKADKHNHGYLNKYEFKKADADLFATLNRMAFAEIKQLAGDASMGHWKPGQEKPDAKTTTPPFDRSFAGADTDKDKKVTLAEFTDYVTRALQAADQEINAAAAAAAAAAANAPHGGYGGHGGGRR